jgi:elongation factor 1 alpha-like protein
MSKLQALAAARKKKTQEQKSESTGLDQPTAGPTLAEMNKSFVGSGTDATTSVKQTPRGFPIRKRKDSQAHEKTLKAPSTEEKVEESNENAMSSPSELDQAEPSAFASTMFSSSEHLANQSNNLFTLSYTAKTVPTTANPFSGPSPDDVVIAAQSKGSAISARPENQN